MRTPGVDVAMATDPNPVVVIGGAGIMAGVAPIVREIAERTNIGVLNTWAAKGLFPWSHPAHLGTMGLQAGDIVLAGLPGHDDVILCGVSEEELPRDTLTALGVPWRDIEPGDLEALALPTRSDPTPHPPLYDELFAVCQPMFTDDTLPLNPARAAADLAAVLPDGGVVCGDASRSGFWLGRTIPTRALGSVRLPTRSAPGFAAMQADQVRRTGHFSIAVVDSIDAGTRSVLDRAVDRAADLVVEVWSADGPPLSSSERVERLLAAHAAGGVHVLQLGVRFGEIERLVAVAGAPLWGA